MSSRARASSEQVTPQRNSIFSGVSPAPLPARRKKGRKAVPPPHDPLQPLETQRVVGISVPPQILLSTPVAIFFSKSIASTEVPP